LAVPRSMAISCVRKSKRPMLRRFKFKVYG
jgi:hypothetical protein